MFSREGEGQHTTDHFRVGRNSLDIFSPVRDGEETSNRSFTALPSTCTICTLLFQSLDFLKFLMSLMLTKAALSIYLSTH